MSPIQPGKIIVVFGTKGGVGKTVIATNLAVSLAAESAGPVALLDLDVMGVGDAAKMLHLTPEHSLVDLAPFLQEAGEHGTNAQQILSQLTPHAPSNVHFLPIVRSAQQVRSLNAKWLKPLLQVLTRSHRYVVIDGGRTLSDTLLATLDESNLILLVLTPDILALSHAKWSLNLLKSLLFPIHMVKVVLNRADSRGSVDTDDVRSAIQCDVLAEIPSDGKTVGMAINQGVPLLTYSGGAKVTQAIRGLANELARSPALYLNQLDQTRERNGELTSGVVESNRLWSGSTPMASSELYAGREDRADEVAALKRRIHEGLVEKLDLRKLDIAALNETTRGKELRQQAESIIVALLAKEVGATVSSHEVRQQLVKEIVDEALGLGPLEELLADPEISDILVNNKDQIYVERHGKLTLTKKQFTSNDQVRIVIERIVAPLGRRIDESAPMVDARLPDGSRVNAIIPPLSLKGPMLSIRKFGQTNFRLEDLVRFNSLSESMGKFIQYCVLSRKNLIVSGGTGSGKTTLLNVLSSFIPTDERILTIEDAAELRLTQTHWAALEARAANIEGRGAVTIRDLFRNALRMRPDRIIIGECRGAESLDMLQAMNTGHDGSLTTIHANSPRDVISRLDSMVLMSNIELPVRAIREQIASAVQIICHTARLSDGTRKVTKISEVIGITHDLEIEMRDLFVFQQTGVDEQNRVLGHFTATGELPSFLGEAKLKGFSLPAEMFRPVVVGEHA